MDKKILFQKIIIGILIITILPWNLFSQSSGNSSNPFKGKKFQEGLFLGEFALDFTFTDKNGIDLIGIKIDEWFQIDDFTYFYYRWNKDVISVLDTDSSVLCEFRYSLSAEGKELKILFDDGTFRELKEKGTLIKSTAKDAVAGVLSTAAIIWGGKEIYNARKNK